MAKTDRGEIKCNQSQHIQPWDLFIICGQFLQYLIFLVQIEPGHVSHMKFSYTCLLRGIRKICVACRFSTQTIVTWNIKTKAQSFIRQTQWTKIWGEDYHFSIPSRFFILFVLSLYVTSQTQLVCRLEITRIATICYSLVFKFGMLLHNLVVFRYKVALFTVVHHSFMLHFPV